MRIVSIHARDVPVASTLRNAVMDFTRMTTSIVAVMTDVVHDGRTVVGFGFGSCGRYAQGGILRDRMIPRLLETPAAALLDEPGTNLDPFRAWQAMMTGEKPGGHGERSVAVGALDMALWDLVSKIAGKPLFRLLSERFNAGRGDPDVPVYAAGGYYPSGSGSADLQNELRSYLDQGYETVKIKVGGTSQAEDIRRIEAALAAVGKGSALAVDANGRFESEAALRFGEAIAPYGLRWYEEPCDPLDFATLAEVAAASSTPIATGENLFSLPDARNLIRYGGLEPERDVLQMDPALSYGLVEYLRILRMLEEQGWSRRRCIPHGGHQFALHVAAGLGLGGVESYPGVFRPFGGFADGAPVKRGIVRLPEAPGIGFELKSELMTLFEPLTDGHP